MKTLNFFYDILLEFGAPVTGHDFLLRVIPPSLPGQEILDVTLSLDPCVPYARQHDGFGNLLQLGRIEEPHDHFRYTVRGTARLDHSRRRYGPTSPMYRYPSPLTAPDRSMRTWLHSLELPQSPRDLAWALSQAVHDRMEYRPGATGVHTTASEAFSLGAGVCQDFAHVYLALARLAGLPARYVNGLPEGDGASHAWCEVWLEGVWTGIDPTRDRWADEGYIRFGAGRDFGDCAIERGVFRGGGTQTQTVFMRVTEQ